MTGARWRATLGRALGSDVVDARVVSGGDINEAYRVRLADDRVVFVKRHPDPPAGMFAAEARGLGWLAAGPLRVPQVLVVDEELLALEWLAIGARGDGFDEALGRGLAGLHGVAAASFGLDDASYLATLPQLNTPTTDGVEFWVEQRLRPLAERARRGGRMPDVRGQLDALRARPDRFGPAEPPVRLHGDLWWGNVVAVAGAPVLIDPAAYAGHREVDLAMLALFGGLPPAVIAAYEEVAPLADGWQDRVALWQLYPLVAHAVLFGGGYGAQVARTLDALV